MDDQSQSLDALLQLNQDFSVPDQLFDDSEIGVANVYNTVEIETSDTHGGYENEAMVKDDDDAMVSTESAASASIHEPSPLAPIPDVTTNNSLCKQDRLSSSTTVHQKSDVKQGIVTTKPTETHSSQPMPLVTQASTNHAPLKMVSVPVNSDVITQGNSQVVLIPVGGMDSSKLEGNLKVPLGQKLVIIKPQEILKTIEEQKSHKAEKDSPGASVDQARNLSLTQHGIVLQGSHQGGLQHMPLSQVGKLVAASSSQVPAKKGLVNVAPKGVPIPPRIQRTSRSNPTQQGLTTKVPPRCAMAPTVQQQLHKTGVRPLEMADQVAQQSHQPGQMNTGQKVVTVDQVLRKTLQNAAAGSVVITTPKIPSSAVDKVGIVQPVSQTKISNLTPTKPQQTPSQLCTPSDEVGGKSTDQTTSQTSSTTSQTSSTTSQTSFTTSKTSSTTSQTSSTTSQTCLTTSQTRLVTSQQMSTTAGIEKASTSCEKPNLYKKLKENQAKLGKGSSVSSKNTTGSVLSQVESFALEVKSTVDVESNVQSSESQKAQTVVPVSKTSSQKIVVTYVSPTGKVSQKIDGSRSTNDRIGDIIQVPAKVVVDEQNRSSPGPSEKNLKATNISVPQSSSGSTVSSGQQPKMVPRILPQVRDIKTEKLEKHVDLPSTSSISPIKSPSSAKQPKRSPIEDRAITATNVSKRGRPRKSQQSVTNTQNVKKTSSGPTLKHELDRQGRGYSGRLKAARSSEHQMKLLKYKRVSNTNPWACALCGKVSFADSLGCLYGPYDESSDVAKEGGSSDGGEPQFKRKRGSSLSEDGSPRKTGAGRDLWFHGDCIVWSPGVFVLGESLAGYAQVVSDAQSRKCDYCATCGATLVCLQRACKKQFHFSCAKQTGCVFEESNYTIQCGKHMKLKHKRSRFSPCSEQRRQI